MVRFYFVLLGSVLNLNLAIAHVDFSDVISKVKPQVVTIYVKSKSNKLSKKERKELNKLLGEYADYYKEDHQPTSSKSIGTGFVIKAPVKNEKTFVLTAEHVVRRAKNIYVNLSGVGRVKGKVVWSDRQRDVALLAITKPSHLTGLNMSPVRMKEGHEVLAISGAFGLSLSSSTGIISALDVKLKKGQKFGLMQTDAAVNPGSSGGPLFNERGEVVGLISNIYSNTGNFSGAAFVTPADVLIRLLEKNGFDG